MINIIFGSNVLLGVIVISGMFVLYCLRAVKPDVAREEDILVISIGFLYSSILVLHGWRLDPILIFSQLLVIFTIFGLGAENIRLRALTAKLLKRLKKNEESEATENSKIA